MNRLLQDWSFTQLGGGEGTKDGEWLAGPIPHESNQTSG
jgi:hypothetical protein